MMPERISAVLLVLGSGLTCYSQPCNAQMAASGCRDLSQEITYDSPPPRNARAARVIGAQVREGSAILVTTVAGGFYATSDFGKNWTAIRGGNLTLLKRFPDAILTPSDPKTVYKYGTIGRIERSQDGGVTWIQPRPVVDGIPAEDMAFRLTAKRSYVLEFEIAAADPIKPLTIYATITSGPRRGQTANFSKRYFVKGMYVSEDGGDNWRRFSENVGIFDIHASRIVLGLSPVNPDVMFGEGQQGVLRSVDGGKTWVDVGQSALLNTEAVDKEERDHNVVFKRRYRLNVQKFIFDPTSANIVYMLSRAGVHRTLDGGDTWTLINLGFDRLNAVNSFAIDPLQPSRVFAGTDRGLFMSEDRGCHFTIMSLPDSNP
jgi:hypothetical protein